MQDARATTAKHFEDEYKRLLAANQKLEQQIKARSEDKPEGIMSMVSQAIKRGSGASPSAQDTKAADGKVDSELSDTMKQVSTWSYLSIVKGF